MDDQLDLNTLEKLLESMDSNTIRQRYARQLAANPQCLAMLEEYDELDANLERLKQAAPPPPLARPTVKKRRTWLALAVPLAALVVLAIVLKAPEVKPLMEESVAPEQTEDLTSVDLERDERIEGLSAPQSEPQPKGVSLQKTKETSVPQEEPAAIDTLNDLDDLEAAPAVPAPVLDAVAERKAAPAAPAASATDTPFGGFEKSKKEDKAIMETELEEEQIQRDRFEDIQETSVHRSLEVAQHRQDDSKRFRTKAGAQKSIQHQSPELAWLRRFFSAWQEHRPKDMAGLFESQAEISWPLLASCQELGPTSCFQVLDARYALIEFYPTPMSSTQIACSLVAEDRTSGQVHQFGGILNIHLSERGKCTRLLFRSNTAKD